MTEALLILVSVLLAPVSALAVVFLVRLRREMPRGSERAAMNEAEKAAAEEGRRMDDGFNALMTYSVKLGRGRVSGGEP